MGVVCGEIVYSMATIDRLLGPDPDSLSTLSGSDYSLENTESYVNEYDTLSDRRYSIYNVLPP